MWLIASVFALSVAVAAVVVVAWLAITGGEE